MNGRDRQEAERDFRNFFLTALSQGAPGIRTNFNGCLLCPDEATDAVLAARMLVWHASVLELTGGRPLAADVCLQHVAEIQAAADGMERLARSAIARIRRDPVV